VFIDGSPQIDPLAADLQEDLVQVPDAARSPLAPAQAGREALTEVAHPATDALVADDDSTFKEKYLHVAEAEGETVVEPDRIRDDLGWEAVPMDVAWTVRH
jgi:hypothetical protein